MGRRNSLPATTQEAALTQAVVPRSFGVMYLEVQLPHHVVRTISDLTVVSLENEPLIRHLKRPLVQVLFLI